MATVNDVALGDFVVYKRRWCRILDIEECPPNKNWWERTPAAEHREVFEKYKKTHAGKPLQAIPAPEVRPLLYPAAFVDAVLTLETPDGEVVKKGVGRNAFISAVPAPLAASFYFGLKAKKETKKTTKKTAKKSTKKKAKKKAVKKKSRR